MLAFIRSFSPSGPPYWLPSLARMAAVGALKMKEVSNFQEGLHSVRLQESGFRPSPNGREGCELKRRCGITFNFVLFVFLCFNFLQDRVEVSPL